VILIKIMVECIHECEGYILGEKYKMISCSGQYIEVENSTGFREIMSDKYFSGAGKRLSKNNK